MQAQRKTRQKEAILSTLSGSNRPLCLEEILSQARQLCPGLGERTVFRKLSEMTQDNQLIRVHFPGQPVRYEVPHPDGGHHPHFICRDCGQVFVLPGETPDNLSRIKQPPEFIFEGEEVIIFGRCAPGLCPTKPEKAP
ncbi:MAG: transcriptional repressor [Verrucomicrobiota bacterium]